MRKILWVTVLMLALLFCACAAADTSYSLAPCPGSVEIPDAKFIVLTRDNLSSHPDLLSRIGKTEEQLIADWEERGVVIQAWFQSKTPDSCLEISVREDADSKLYYDLVNHSSDQGWKSFINSHKGGSAYTEEGYSLRDVAKKQQANKNYFLRLSYKRTAEDKVYWGYVAKTVARGYTLVFDYQVYNRGLRAGDQAQLNRIVNTLELSDTGSGAAGSSSSSGFLQITAAPPVETNEDTFTVEGRTVPGAEIIGVLMNEETNPSNSKPANFTAVADQKNGSFKLKVALPYEKTWLLTLTVMRGDTMEDFHAFPMITYSKTLLPLTFDSPVPDMLSSDETVISGTTDKGVTVQCIVTDGGKTNFTKQIKTNGTGRFTFKVPTAEEANYHFTLVFSKKGFETKRFTYDVSRSLSEEERRESIRKSAIRPNYNALMDKSEKYLHQVMGYNLYVTDVQQSGDEWIIVAAMVRSGSQYKNIVYFTASEYPKLEIGSRCLIYGEYVGSYVVQVEDGGEQFPGFNLLFVVK